MASQSDPKILKEIVGLAGLKLNYFPLKPRSNEVGYIAPEDLTGGLVVIEVLRWVNGVDGDVPERYLLYFNLVNTNTSILLINMRNQSVSMKQIADHAGVSIMTVSRVLRNESNVAAKTEKLIRGIADELGYKPNRLVRGMQSGRSGIVSVIMPVGHQIAPSILEGIYDCLHDRDMILALDLVHGNVGERALFEQAKVINRLLETRVDGFILLPVNEEASPLYFKEVIDRRMPLVLVDRNTTNFQADFIGTDDFEGGREAARMLAFNGCKRVILISAGPAVSTSRLRAEGFRAGVQAFGSSLVTEIVTPSFSHNTDVIDFEIDKHQGKFDGIFAISDRLGISAWHSCRHLGMQIPEEVKIIGFGALNLRDPRVALSSFDQEPYKTGWQAATLLLERMDKGPWKRRPKPKAILRKPIYVEGTSCASAD